MTLILILLLTSVGCQGSTGSTHEGMQNGLVATPTNITPAISPQAPATPRLEHALSMTHVIQDIFAQPDMYIGRSVEVVGYFRGWDLLQEVEAAPPVRKSDWVITDASGSIYVTGLLPQQLDPSSLADTDSICQLVATVQATQKGGLYLKAQSVEVISR